jgi:hypothetical protein
VNDAAEADGMTVIVRFLVREPALLLTARFTL